MTEDLWLVLAMIGLVALSTVTGFVALSTVIAVLDDGEEPPGQ